MENEAVKQNLPSGADLDQVAADPNGTAPNVQLEPPISEIPITSSPVAPEDHPAEEPHPATKAGPSADDTHPALEEVDDVGPKTILGERLGPRGTGAPLDAQSEEERKKAADETLEASKNTITDAVDSIGNVQTAEDSEGNVEPHHQNVGPRGTGAPKDTFRQ